MPSRSFSCLCCDLACFEPHAGERRPSADMRRHRDVAVRLGDVIGRHWLTRFNFFCSLQGRSLYFDVILMHVVADDASGGPGRYYVRFFAQNSPKPLRERLSRATAFATEMSPCVDSPDYPDWAPGLLIRSMCWSGIQVVHSRGREWDRTSKGILDELTAAVEDVFDPEFAALVMSFVPSPRS